MIPDETTRRRLLAGTGLAGTALIAGCLGGSSDETGSSEGNMSGDDMDDEGDMDDGGMGDDGMDDGDGMDDDDGMTEQEPTDPADAPRTSVDRFSEAAGTLQIRTEDNGLPGPDEPIDFDQQPFLTHGFGPDGEPISYYNFDVQPTEPAPIYVLIREDEDGPVEDQLNIIDVVPGDDGYNDFWQVHEVTVPSEYEANTATSLQDIEDAGYEITATDTIKNCPVVPDGSTASMRHGDGNADLGQGWYDGQVVSYFLFEEAPLSVQSGEVPLSPIYVSFNTNPGEDGGGPPSGFMTEESNDRTHNVVATLPDDDAYSPLWLVNIYDNADFGEVSDLDSATDAEVLNSGAANVNCPVVSVESTMN